MLTETQLILNLLRLRISSRVCTVIKVKKTYVEVECIQLDTRIRWKVEEISLLDRMLAEQAKRIYKSGDQATEQLVHLNLEAMEYKSQRKSQ